MIDPARQIADAEREAMLARERVTQTLAVLQERLNPRNLARQAVRDATEAGTAAALASVDTAKRNPGALAGATAVAGLFLARHRIMALFRRKHVSSPDEPNSLPPPRLPQRNHR